MSIETVVDGDPDAVTTTASRLGELNTVVAQVATDLATVRNDADAAWEGFRASAFLSDIDGVATQVSTLADRADTLIAAVTTFATALATVVEDMATIRSDALLAGLTVTSTGIPFPGAPADDATDAQLETRVDQVTAWHSLNGRVGDVRTAEVAAHEQVTEAVAAFLSDGVVLDLLERAGFIPASSSPGDLSQWALGLGLTGFGWTADWWTKLGIGRYAPRGPGGQFRAVQAPWYREAWSARQSSNWVANPGQAASRGAWSTAGTWAGRVGTVFSFGTAAHGQWQEDADDPSLNGTEQVTRAATVGATTAAGGWAGAWAGGQVGAMIGTAVGGPVGTVIGGAVGGLIGGMIGSGVGDAIGDALKEPVGDFVDALTFWD
ncbi:glycine zipper domain-containing protein [Georgenia wangjunii]|uniref:glycine zipper domain-containing protein n=1 Tax=Georgenia wangjunii TaxID=3117730 RepID=UPI002F268ADC